MTHPRAAPCARRRLKWTDYRSCTIRGTAISVLFRADAFSGTQSAHFVVGQVSHTTVAPLEGPIIHRPVGVPIAEAVRPLRHADNT
jgi:hypothetical protein